MLPREGIDPMVRGQLVHLMLALVWQRLKNHHKLTNLSHDELKTLLIECQKETLAKINLDYIEPMLKNIEEQRLQKMALNTLLWEKNRTPFTVLHVEKEFQIELAGVLLTVRVDRMDSTCEGKKWVIDYKNRLPHYKPWNEERPTEPQLLLYGLLDKEIDTSSFCKLMRLE